MHNGVYKVSENWLKQLTVIVEEKGEEVCVRCRYRFYNIFITNSRSSRTHIYLALKMFNIKEPHLEKEHF